MVEKSRRGDMVAFAGGSGSWESYRLFSRIRLSRQGRPLLALLEENLVALVEWCFTLAKAVLVDILSSL